MNGDYFPDLVKVFYVNLKVVDGLIYSRVKGVDIKIDEAMWITIARFHPEGLKSYQGIPRINNMGFYKNFLRFPDEPRDFTLLRVVVRKGMRGCVHLFWPGFWYQGEQTMLN